MIKVISTILAASGVLSNQFFAPRCVPLSDTYSSSDFFAPVAQPLGLTLEFSQGNPRKDNASYLAHLGYRLTHKYVAVQRGIYHVELVKYPSAEEALEQIVTRKGASASNPPKMVEISQTWKTIGYSLFDALPPRPESALSWRAFIVDQGFLYEIRIKTGAPASFDSDGKVVRTSSGDIDLPPLSREHGVLAKAILDEVYKRGKTLKLWGVE